MNSRPVTIIDIAEELGISKTTVSAALHGNGRVSKRTRDRVFEAADRLGYVSNRAAQKLRSNRAQSIGLHLFANSQALSFYMDFAFGVMEIAASEGLDLVLLTETEDQPRKRHLSVDGLLVLDPSPHDRFIDTISRTHIPIVAVGPVSPEQQPLILGQIFCRQDLVTPILLDRLSAGEARRPAIVSLEKRLEPLWASESVDAYVAWMRAASMEPIIIRAEFPAQANEADRIAAELLSRGADSALIVQQGLAAQVSRQYRERTGEPFPVAALTADPASEHDLDHLISVDLQIREYGEKAARLLVDVMRNGRRAEEPIVHSNLSIMESGTARSAPAFPSK